MRRIVCFGPGPIFKGGISNYNTSLAKSFDKIDDTEVHIVSWTHQYPSIIPRAFKDDQSKADLLKDTGIQTTYLTNYNNPATWNKTAKYIQQLNPDIVIFQWAIAIQGIPLGWIARKLKSISNCEIIFDLHFVIQKENSKLDKVFTKYGISPAHSYVVHALKTFDELKTLFPKKHFHLTEEGVRSTDKTSVIKLYHPVYDLFQVDESFDVEAFKNENGLNKYVFLYFGFIRKYKGLHNAIAAFEKVSKTRNDVSFLICGESFWNTLDNSKLSTKIKNAVFGLAKKILIRKKDDEKNYNPLELIQSLNLQDKTMVVNQFIPNEDVNKYFQVSDNVILFYEYATPSGIESLSYNFKLPILATAVGHFPETVKDGFNGYLATPEDVDSMADVMLKSLEHPIDRNNVAATTEKLSWHNYALAILNQSSVDSTK